MRGRAGADDARGRHPADGAGARIGVAEGGAVGRAPDAVGHAREGDRVAQVHLRHRRGAEALGVATAHEDGRRELVAQAHLRAGAAAEVGVAVGAEGKLRLEALGEGQRQLHEARPGLALTLHEGASRAGDRHAGGVAQVDARVGRVGHFLLAEVQAECHAGGTAGKLEQLTGATEVDTHQLAVARAHRGDLDGVEHSGRVQGRVDDTIELAREAGERATEGLVGPLLDDEVEARVGLLAAAVDQGAVEVPAGHRAAGAQQRTLGLALDGAQALAGLDEAIGNLHRATGVVRVGGGDGVGCRGGSRRVAGLVAVDHQLAEELDIARELEGSGGQGTDPLGLRQQVVVGCEVVGADVSGGADTQTGCGNNAVSRAVAEGSGGHHVARHRHEVARVARGRAEVQAAESLQSVVRVARERTLGRVEPILLEVVEGRHHVEAVLGEVAEAARDGRAPLLQAAALGVAEAHAGLGTLEVAAQDDVDHAGDGIRAVDSRSAVLQDLDALDGADRDAVEVDEVDVDVLGEAVVGQAAPVEQHERGVDAQATDRHGRGARGEGVAGARAFVEGAAADHGQVTQHVIQRRLARALDVLARDHRHGLEGFGVDPLDVGAGDLDALGRLLSQSRRRGEATEHADRDGQLSLVAGLLEHGLDPARDGKFKVYDVAHPLGLPWGVCRGWRARLVAQTSQPG